MKTAMQELFSQLELEHPNLFNTNTLEGRKFINDYYKFFELEKKQIINAWELEGDEYVRNGKDYYDVTFEIKQI
jgi:hypothetical protein